MQGLQFALEPIVDLNSGRVLGAEMLTRVRADNGAFESPKDLAYVLKQSEFREFLLVEAVARWIEYQKTTNLMPNFVSININAAELASERIVTLLLSMIYKSCSEPSRFRFELTEDVSQADVIDLRRGAERLCEHHVGLYIDDFGSGHRPFAYLTELPVIGFKLDHTLVRQCVKDSRLRFLVKACAGLARDIQVDVVAEGIEDYSDELAVLATGIQKGQGYFYGQPFCYI